MQEIVTRVRADISSDTHTSMIDRWPLIVPPIIRSRAPNSATGGTVVPSRSLISSLADGMGSSQSDGAQQQQSMFKVKGLTLIKEAVNGLVKSFPRKEPTDFPETTLISLTSLKSRVVAALTAQGDSPVSGANSCSRSLRSRPSTSQATDSCAAQGPKRSATAMTTHSEPPLLLKQPKPPKLERERSPDPRPAQSLSNCPEQTARGKQSLRSRKRYFGAGVSSKRPHANAASSTYESRATPVHVKVEPLEELPQPQEASLPCHSAEVSPPSSMPNSLPGTSPVKVEPANAPSGVWDIPPKLWEDMQSVLFTHLDST
ncbi:uncharacterized protein LOC115327239 [Ixodes scapularis]|uniref:uncharacterized protein LOC115327239 n=1 Tax=Ixodes scapularis TaxID=6945 RepID=UPI001C393036|nr:uncharacterized protein LOC115327239 [Ixodes scapularis]